MFGHVFKALAGLNPRKMRNLPLNTAKDAALPAKIPAKGKKDKKDKKDETDHELEGLMSEIESDLQADEFKKIWKAYGNLIVAFVVLALIAVFGVQFYRQREAQQHEAAGRAYETALKISNEGKRAEAIKELGVLTAGNDEGYRSLARLAQAALQVQEKNVDGAVANYKALAADQKADPVLRDLAVLLRVLHSIDREDAKALEAELTPLLAPDNAFNPSALELQALLAAKQGDTPRAVKILATVSADPNASAAQRERVGDLSKMYQFGVMPPPPAAPIMSAPIAPAPAAAPAAKP